MSRFHTLSHLCMFASLLFVASCSAASASSIQVRHEKQSVSITTPHLALTCSLTTGRWQAQWHGNDHQQPVIRGADCAVELAHGFDQHDVTLLTASQLLAHTCAPSDMTSIKNVLGAGTQIVIHHRTPGQPELRQIFWVYPDHAYFFARLEVHSPRAIASHDISPFVVDSTKASGTVSLDDGSKPRTLFVPYDNDAFVRYSSDYAQSSYEVTSIYNNASRHGFVVGSVSHDLWKTGITMGKAEDSSLPSLRVFGGVTGKDTRDTQPHGTVTGKVVSSPRIMIGCFSDWRDGMETYGRVNARLDPPLAWHDAVPFGWNSWAAYMTSVSSANYMAASIYFDTIIKPHDPKVWTPTYVNLDSFWDNFSVAKKIEDVKQIHAKGQKAGIYWTPFVYWGNKLSQPVEGTNGRYTYGDAVLKGADGKPLPALDGGMPMDPTHPATLARIDWQCRQFVLWGFDFVKLDFLTHGSLEGAHFNPHIMTGTAAYRIGMARVTAALSPAKIGRPFFISLSIAPLFPAGYGHSRRISCDTFGTIGNSEYMLNSLTYGWWAGGTVYSFNDADSVLLYQAHGQPVTMAAEGRSRLNATVVTGSLILDSDDIINPIARERVLPLLTNHEVLALARQGKAFRPVEGDTGSDASDVFVRRGQSTGEYYIGVFNYSATDAATKHISMARLGLSPTAFYQMHDLWTGQNSRVQGSITLPLEIASSTILRLTRE